MGSNKIKIEIDIDEFRDILRRSSEMKHLDTTRASNSSAVQNAFDEDTGWDEDLVEDEIEDFIESKRIKE